MLKDLTDTLVGLGRAFNVLLGTNLLLDLSGLCTGKSGSCLIQRVQTHLLLGNGSLRGLVKLLDGLLVVSEILLTSNEDDGKTLAEMQDLGDPLSKNKSCQHAARHVRWQFRAGGVPSPGRCQGSRASRRRNRSE